MNGAGVGKMLREDPATRQTKILMYSSTPEVWDPVLFLRLRRLSLEGGSPDGVAPGRRRL